MTCRRRSMNPKAPGQAPTAGTALVSAVLASLNHGAQAQDAPPASARPAASAASQAEPMDTQTVTVTDGAGLGQVSIRGVTTGDQTIATVGIYVDDVAFGSSSAFAAGSTMALDMSLLDQNHIEVLRGPQGTLYGAGAMGGLLKYVTNEPDTRASSRASSRWASAPPRAAASATWRAASSTCR